MAELEAGFDTVACASGHCASEISSCDVVTPYVYDLSKFGRLSETQFVAHVLRAFKRCDDKACGGVRDLEPSCFLPRAVIWTQDTAGR